MNIGSKVVFITGAGGGIGAATARELHAAGAYVVLVDLSEGPIGALAKELGDRALPIVASVTSREQLEAAVAKTIAHFGGIDVVFANAGIACDPPTTIRSMDYSTFERIIEIDLLGVWRTVRACLPQIHARQGYVLITASLYAYVNGVCNAPYAMSKAGVEMMGRALRVELAASGASAGVLYPGWVSTPIARSAMGGHATTAALVNKAFPGPYRKPIQPERVAKAVRDGIANRSARIHCPARWIPLSLLRGILSPVMDWGLERNRDIQSLIRQLE